MVSEMIAPYRLLAERALERIHESALAVLEETGCRIHSRRLLRLLADHGSDIDAERSIARIPATVVSSALADAPASFTLYDRNGKAALEMGSGEAYAASGHGALYVIDEETDERRRATKADAIDFALLSDALDSVAFVAPIVFPGDASTRSSSLHAIEAILANTCKHLFFCADTADVVGTCFELARIVAGTDDLSGRPRISFQVSPSSPLMWTPDATRMLIAAAEAGVPTCILASAMCGVSAPYTLAGTLVLHHAETLSGIVLAQLLRPGLPCIYSAAMSSFDMRRGHPLMGSPESALLAMGSLQLASLCRLPTHTCFPCSESHCLDEQQAWEKIWTTMPAMVAGSDMVVNMELFAGGLTASHAQLVLDAEMMSGLQRLRRGFHVTEATLAVEAIAAVGPGGSFLGEEHTVAHLRTGEHWLANVSNRLVYDTWMEQGGRNVVQSARERARELLRTHIPPQLDRGITREMRALVDAYDRSAEA
jgi:trimethylamine--corrinoid protein Co-methyltransferase